MSLHRPRKNGKIQLERTGPFVPPMSLPGAVDAVVTDSFRLEMEKSGLTGIEFQTVIKKRIVKLNWREWDLAKPEPPTYPDNGEPEEYILGKLHSPIVSWKMGKLWEVLFDVGAKVERIEHETVLDEIFLKTNSWNGKDFFRADDVGFVYCTEKAKDWLRNRVAPFVDFEEAETR